MRQNNNQWVRRKERGVEINAAKQKTNVQKE